MAVDLNKARSGDRCICHNGVIRIYIARQRGGRHALSEGGSHRTYRRRNGQYPAGAYPTWGIALNLTQLVREGFGQ